MTTITTTTPTTKGAAEEGSQAPLSSVTTSAEETTKKVDAVAPATGETAVTILSGEDESKHQKLVSFTKLEAAIKSLDESGEAPSAECKQTLLSLKELQFEHIRIEEAYRREWNEMKLRYLAKFQPLYKKRWSVLTGRPEEMAPPPATLPEPTATTSTAEETTAPPPEEIDVTTAGTKHLPKFWLKAMKNHPLLDEMIEECDLPILEYLEDIRFSWVDSKDQTSFRLEFLFAPNPFFKNSMLTKTYYLEPSEDDDEESVLTRTVGTTLEWYQGKNVTEKTLVRRQRNKRTNQTRVVNEKVKVNSFFNFFKTYEIPSEDQLYGLADQDVSELEMILEAEFELGAVLRDKLIPRALGWYLGIEHDDLQSEDADIDDFDEDENENGDSSASSDDKE